MGNLSHAQVEIDYQDYGLDNAFLRKSTFVDNYLRNLTREVATRLQVVAQREAPRRGDFRRGATGAPGNLRDAIDKGPVVHIETTDSYEALVGIDEGLAPYAKWVLGGSGPKFSKGVRTMRFPETRSGGRNVNKWWAGHFFDGNPRNDFFLRAVEEVKVSEWLNGRMRRTGEKITNIRQQGI